MSSGDLVRLIIAVSLVLLYTSFANCTFSFRSKWWIATTGVFAAILGYVSGAGLAYLLGVTHTPPVEATPFLVIGIGVDDIFVILNAYSLTYTNVSPRRRVSLAIRDSGLSITITTLTSIIAFIIGAVSPFFSISMFCIITAASLMMGYIMCLTFFLGWLCIDAAREGKKIAFLKNTGFSNPSLMLNFENSRNNTALKDMTSYKPQRAFTRISSEPSGNYYSTYEIISFQLANQLKSTKKRKLLKKHDDMSLSYVVRKILIFLRIKSRYADRKSNVKDNLAMKDLCESNPTGNDKDIKSNRNQINLLPNFQNDNENSSLDPRYNFFFHPTDQPQLMNIGSEINEAQSKDFKLDSFDDTNNRELSHLNCNVSLGSNSDEEILNTHPCETNDPKWHPGVALNGSHKMDSYLTMSTQKSNSMIIISEYNKNNEILKREEYLGDSLSQIIEEPSGNIGKAQRIFCLRYITAWITSFWSKVIIILLFVLYLALSINGLRHLKSGLSLKDVTPNDSFLRKFYDFRESYFADYGEEIIIFFPNYQKWENSILQKKIIELNDEINSSNISAFVLNGFVEFLRQSGDKLQDGNRSLFVQTLRSWLQDSVIGKLFVTHFIFDEYTNDLITWKFYCWMPYNDNTSTVNDWLNELRGDLKKQDEFFTAEAFTSLSPMWESDSFMLYYTLSSLAIALASIMLVVFIMIPDCVSGILVVMAVIFVDLGLFGFMYYCDLELNLLTMVNLLISIGFSVDYTIHMMHVYTHCVGNTNELRVKESLTLMGIPVTHGMISTLLPICTLATANKYALIVFFRMMILVMLFAYSHGIILLPTILSLFNLKKRMLTSH